MLESDTALSVFPTSPRNSAAISSSSTIRSGVGAERLSGLRGAPPAAALGDDGRDRRAVAARRRSTSRACCWRGCGPRARVHHADGDRRDARPRRQSVAGRKPADRARRWPARHAGGAGVVANRAVFSRERSRSVCGPTCGSSPSPSCASIVTAVVCGLAPALQTGRTPLNASLNERSRSATAAACVFASCWWPASSHSLWCC